MAATFCRSIIVPPKRSFVYFTRRSLNRILFHEKECQIDENGKMIATIPIDDYRSKHIIEILKLSADENIRVGIINKGLTDTAVLKSTSSDSLLIDIGSIIDLVVPPIPTIDLILGIPRPRLLPNLLSTISCLGVHQLFLLKSAKVDKSYMSSHYFRQTELLEKSLIEGLMQCNSDCWLPKYHICHKLKDIQQQLHESYSNNENILKIIAHPFKSTTLTTATNTNYGQRKRINEMRTNERNDANNSLYDTNQDLSIPSESQQLSQFLSSMNHHNLQKLKIILAIGPDGGWSDEELYFFYQNNFHFINLGDRILRTDMAVRPPPPPPPPSPLNRTTLRW